MPSTSAPGPVVCQHRRVPAESTVAVPVGSAAAAHSVRSVRTGAAATAQHVAWRCIAIVAQAGSSLAQCGNITRPPRCNVAALQLGLIVYEMLTGVPLFENVTGAAVISGRRPGRLSCCVPPCPIVVRCHLPAPHYILSTADRLDCAWHRWPQQLLRTACLAAHRRTAHNIRRRACDAQRMPRAVQRSAASTPPPSSPPNHSELRPRRGSCRACS
jgi:hypothetical protein